MCLCPVFGLLYIMFPQTILESAVIFAGRGGERGGAGGHLAYFW